MNSRRDFLKQALGATVVTAAVPLLCETCGGEAVAAATNPAPTGTTITFDLSKSPYTVLNQQFGSISYKVPGTSTYLVVSRPTVEPLFLVLNASCPHEGGICERFNSRGDDKITCPRHGSKFDIFGQSLSGPAVPGHLTIYEYSFDGDHTLTTELIPLSAAVPAASNSQTRISSISANPFHDRTVIHLQTAIDQHVRLFLSNGSGQEVAVLQDGVLLAGDHSFELDGTSLSSGSYFCILSTNGIMWVRPLIKL